LTTKSREWISRANAVAMMPTGSANMQKPNSMTTPASARPIGVIGTMSP